MASEFSRQFLLNIQIIILSFAIRFFYIPTNADHALQEREFTHTCSCTYRTSYLPAGASKITRVNERRYTISMHTRTSCMKEKRRRIAGGLNEPRIHTGFSLARLFAKWPSCLCE